MSLLITDPSLKALKHPWRDPCSCNQKQPLLQVLGWGWPQQAAPVAGPGLWQVCIWTLEGS